MTLGERGPRGDQGQRGETGVSGLDGIMLDRLPLALLVSVIIAGFICLGWQEVQTHHRLDRLEQRVIQLGSVVQTQGPSCTDQPPGLCVKPIPQKPGRQR